MNGTLSAHRGNGTDVLVVTASTGAGHDSVALAIGEAIGDLAPDVRVRIVDPFDFGDRNGLMSPGRWYDTTVANAPWLWGLFYRVTNREWAVRRGISLGSVLWAHRLRVVIDNECPGVVVSVHPLCTRLAARVAKTMRSVPALHCVVTDLVSVHRCWACQDVNTYYTATTDACGALVAAGVPRYRIQVTGLPVRSSFVRPVADRPPSTTVQVLVLGGGHPTRRFEAVARALTRSRRSSRIVVVCGRNERLKRRLARAVGATATIYGWRDDIASLMSASSVIVTRSGSVSLAEICSQARPALVYQMIPGQEDGNVALLECAGLGRFMPNINELVSAAENGTPLWDESWSTRASWWRGAAARVARHVLASLPTDRHRGR